jgi:hypothetical protein
MRVTGTETAIGTVKSMGNNSLQFRIFLAFWLL